AACDVFTYREHAVGRAPQLESMQRKARVRKTASAYQELRRRVLHRGCFNQRYPAVRLIILMEEPSRDAVLDAFRCGASGVFSRTKPVNDFLTCIDRVSQGEIWASR